MCSVLKVVENSDDLVPKHLKSVESWTTDQCYWGGGGCLPVEEAVFTGWLKKHHRQLRK